jgi:putative transposase
VVGIFPDRDALILLPAPSRLNSTTSGPGGRRYLGLDVLARSRTSLIPDTTQEVHQTTGLQALSA